MAKATNEIPFYRLRIELPEAHIPIWRDVDVPAGIGLHWLHFVLQTSMGWANSHLHEFVCKGTRYTSMEMDPDGMIDETVEEESLYSLDQLLKKKKDKLLYVYDFGDDWRHLVTLKEKLGKKPLSALRCVAGKSAGPLEDCGGIWGHERICDFLSGKGEDPDDSLEEWIPEDYDPGFFDKDFVNKDLGIIVSVMEKNRGFGPEEPEEEKDDLLVANSLPSDEQYLLDGLLDDYDEEEDMDEPEHPYENLDQQTLATYREVLENGALIRELEPWKELWDYEIFCIIDPDTGLPDIVNVLGALGEVLAVQVHTGKKGLAFWHDRLMGKALEYNSSIMENLSLAEISYSNKKDLKKEDIDLYGLSGMPTPPRGKERWMSLLSYSPRRPGWYLRPEDLPALKRGTEFLIHNIQRARREGGYHNFFHTKGENEEWQLPDTLPGFRLKPGTDADSLDNWEFGPIEIDWSQASTEPEIHSPTEFEIERLGSLPIADEPWEVGAVFLNPVMTKNGPVLSLLSAVAPLIPDTPPSEPYLTDNPNISPSEAVWNVFTKYAFQYEKLPAVLQVSTDVAEKTFSPLERFGVKIKRVPELTLLSEMFRMMQEFDL